MIRNRMLMVAVSAVLLLLLGAFAYDHTQKDKIANGVTIGGIDVSELSKAKAKAKLDQQLQQPLLSPVKVRYKGHTSRLTAAGAGVNVDIDGMVDEALTHGSHGFFVIDAIQHLAGTKVNATVATRIDYSSKAVTNFIAGTKKKYDVPAKDASIHYSASSLGEMAGQTGISVKAKRLRREIVATFDDPTASRNIRLPIKIKQPKVTRAQLADKYSTILLVDRKHFKLRLFKKLKLAKTYGIAVGRAGLETPQGLYSINDKQVNPAWHVPNSSWAGKLAGKTIPPNDPGNPIKARWLGIYDGVGIHGTSEPGSIGSAASHGCIRMVPAQVIDLYPRVPLGTPVYIG